MGDGHAGGGSQNPAVGILDHVALALTEHIADQTARGLTELLESDASPRVTALINILQALLAGNPGPARADHPDLETRDVAELRLLLESLGVPPESTDG